MQLKTLAKSKEVLNDIVNIGESYDSLEIIGQKYSTSVLKSAIIQSKLDKMQIRQILRGRGLKDDLLKSTTNELYNTARLNEMNAAQKAAATSSLGLGTAVKGLGIKLKSLAAAHPVLLSTAAAIGSVYAAYKGVESFQNWADGTEAVKGYNKELEKSQQTIQTNTDVISGYQMEIEANNSKIQKLQTLQDNGEITSVQQAELENLRFENALLDDKIEKLQKINDEEAKDSAKTSVEKFNTQFGGSAENSYEKFSKDYDNGLGSVNETLLLDSMSNNSAASQLNTVKYFTDEYNKAVDNLKNGIGDTTQEDVDYYFTALETAKENFSKVEDELWNDLQTEKESLEAVRNEDGSFENDSDRIAYEDIISWEDVFKNYVDEYKKAAEKVQSEANKESIIQPVEFPETSKLLAESQDKSSSATLADLQSEADTLASIKREMSETGKIGVSSMQSITSQFPEANAALAKYMSGLISEQELFNELTAVYASDEENYKTSLILKNQNDEQFFGYLKTNYSNLFNDFSELYGYDVENWKNLATAKAEIESTLMQGIDKNWQNHFNIYKDSVTGLYSIVGPGFDDSDIALTNPGEAEKLNEEYKNNHAQLQSNIDNINNALTQLNNISFDAVSVNNDFSWDTLSGFDEDSFSSQAEAFSEEMNWIERAVNKVSSAYERLKNIVSDTTKNWLSRNSALENSFSVLEDEINTQQQVYRKYTDMFNSYDLDSHYKELISNGTIEIETITDESLKNAIDECIDLYDNAREAKDAVDELTQEYRSLAMTRFDNLKSEYEAQIGLIEDTVGILEAQLSLLETDGYINSKYLYNSLIEAEKENLKNLNAEYAALSSRINTVEEGSENWYSMKTDINSVSEAIINATDSLKGYENELRQIEWDLFDRTRDDVADLIDESDFLYGILEDKGFYDDGGNLNRYGQAAQAMLAQKYELYASQSKAYADEVKKIDEELAKDPYSIDLIDRRQELIKLQQESVQSALDEKNALKDLISDGYEEYKNSLDDIISKYKDLLSTIKDTYDYEKNISELTDNLAALEKQYQAYQGDNSESGRKNVQQLKTELEEARQDLKETEYEKLISDTEKLLDEFQTDVDEWLNERLDHLDVLISDVISQSNANTGAIAGTINEAANSVGYTLSDNMNGIWAVYSGNITNALSEIGNEFTSGQSALHDTVKNIGDSVLELLKYADEEAAGLIAEQGSQANGGSDTGSQTEYETNTWENPASGGGNAGGDAGSSDWSIYKYYYPQDLNVDTSVVDRLKSNNIDASFDARSRYWDMLIGDGEYYSTYEQNVRLLNWLKNNGYAKGSRRILFDQLGLTQERGQELIFSKTLGGMITPLRRGDKVFTSEMTENLWKLAQKPVVPDFNLGDTQLPYIGQQNMSNDVKVSFGDVSVTLPNVKNYSDFMREAQKDPDFTKMVQNIALGQAFGKNTYDRYVY